MPHNNPRARVFCDDDDDFVPLTPEEWAAAEAGVERIYQRRQHLSRKGNLPRCPACDHAQVQLLDSNAVPAEWRCRMCKHPFTHEPAAAP